MHANVDFFKFEIVHKVLCDVHVTMMCIELSSTTSKGKCENAQNA